MRDATDRPSRADRLRARRRRSREAATVAVIAAVGAVVLLAVSFSPGDDGVEEFGAGADAASAPSSSLSAGDATTPTTNGAPEGDFENGATSSAAGAHADPDAAGSNASSANSPDASPASRSDGEQSLGVPATPSPMAADWTGSGEAVTFAFGGDTHFESYLRTQLDADPAGMLDPIAPLLAAADVAVVNLETAITERGEPAAKEYTFRAPASALTALRSAGVDAASLANNHGLDYGVVGVEDALAASAASGLPVIGIGENAAEAYAPYTTTVNGQRVAVIAATQVLDSSTIASWTANDTQGGLASAKEVDRLAAAVREVRPVVDTLAVFLHWGVSEATCPSSDQQGLARALVDAGADIVVGGHAHRQQGAGYLDDAFVAYGLGNFIWYSQPGASSESGVLYVTAVGRDVQSYRWAPAVISNGVPQPLDGDEAAYRVESWEGLRDCTGLAAEPSS